MFAATAPTVVGGAGVGATAIIVAPASVVVPTAIYVGLMPFTGLYLASIVFIAWFMRWLGKYSWTMVAPVAIGMPIIVYIVFEKYFLVALPKGPIEQWLNL